MHFIPINYSSIAREFDTALNAISQGPGLLSMQSNEMINK